MRIANSAVSMASTHEYDSRVSESSTTLQFNDQAVKESFTPLRARVDNFEQSVTLRESETRFSAPEERTASVIGLSSAEASERRASATVSQKREGADIDAAPQSVRGGFDINEDFEDMKASILKKMLEVLRGVRNGEPLKFGELTKGRMLDLRSASYRAMDFHAQLFSAGAEGLPQAGTASSATVWRKVTEQSFAYSEREATTFQSEGYAVTEDGRTLNFDVAFSMSRSFSQNYDIVREEEVVMTDPLIINLDNNAASLSGAKFEFDLDGDGETENVSFAGEGSGFLALDANGNGVIDDGSELFGTKSGDGFADLAAYDDDGNGWIDENDAVYDKLRVWTKDADGADKLTGLKEADVGAIYLGAANTEFSLKDAGSNETNGIIRKTGVYLKESGGAGTLSHVDLRC